jgi:hypothetical protein
MTSAPRTEIAIPWRIAALGASLLTLLAIFAFGYVQSASTFRDSESYLQRTRECQDRALAKLPPATRSSLQVADLENVSELCYDDLRRINQLGESSINRGLYIHQRFENNIVLFMVVLITLSGVALAGVQLLTSYSLAATGHAQGEGATDLSLEQGKLSIKSSVTGLVVLAFSLAFFGLYISQVYNVVPSAEAKDIPRTLVSSAVGSAPASPEIVELLPGKPAPEPPRSSHEFKHPPHP